MVSDTATFELTPRRIDAVNHPEWGYNDVYSPARAPYVNISEYVFDTVPEGQEI